MVDWGTLPRLRVEPRNRGRADVVAAANLGQRFALIAALDGFALLVWCDAASAATDYRGIIGSPYGYSPSMGILPASGYPGASRTVG